MVADGRPERLQLLAKTFPSIQGVKDAGDIIGSTEVDAVVIATPVHTHFELAKRALLQGKHVLIEKPMTSSVREADELMDLASKKGLTLMADHTFLYTGAVQKMNVHYRNLRIFAAIKYGQIKCLRHFITP